MRWREHGSQMSGLVSVARILMVVCPQMPHGRVGRSWQRGQIGPASVMVLARATVPQWMQVRLGRGLQEKQRVVPSGRRLVAEAADSGRTDGG
ncbi:hypothetical protein GCM10010129_56720 [Streptomyces fumigatiscleroticus]|nr:hypothetical protein GCM10010129_56720 [Streptomyces fumigatiscleroticus]